MAVSKIDWYKAGGVKQKVYSRDKVMHIGTGDHVDGESELSVGTFSSIQSNPTHQMTDTTKPNP